MGFGSGLSFGSHFGFQLVVPVFKSFWVLLISGSCHNFGSYSRFELVVAVLILVPDLFSFGSSFILFWVFPYASFNSSSSSDSYCRFK